jgi:glycosyltransferase involved in cell wall biosynthesis
MKVAVYTIALNEEQFVERWAKSCKDATYRIILDTGSTDKTIELAESLGITVVSASIKPWRFDDARNVALAVVPADADYCIALDMDEILKPGWKKELRKAHAEGWTRPRYKYVWSWNPDGSEGLVYGGDKIHKRHGYRWKHPVHEVITPDRLEETQGWTSLEIHHHPDPTKSRGQYFPLLALSVMEDPTDDRNAFYYARELYFNGMLKEAAAEFKRHLSLPKARWAPERAASMRYLAQCEPENAIKYLTDASKEAPEFREPWVELAMAHYTRKEWQECFDAASKALEIIEKPLVYLNDADSWGSKPHDLLAISAYNLGKLDIAVEQGTIAAEMSPEDERLQNNLMFYKATQKGSE